MYEFKTCLKRRRELSKMVQKEERTILPYQGKDTWEQKEVNTLCNELANMKKDIMEERKILSNL